MANTRIVGEDNAIIDDNFAIGDNASSFILMMNDDVAVGSSQHADPTTMQSLLSLDCTPKMATILDTSDTRDIFADGATFVQDTQLNSAAADVGRPTPLEDLIGVQSDHSSDFDSSIHNRSTGSDHNKILRRSQRTADITLRRNAEKIIQENRSVINKERLQESKPAKAVANTGMSAANKLGSIKVTMPALHADSNKYDSSQIDGDSDVQSSGSLTDDDPDKLWCICRKPHNNRFMICCDKCENWFHGSCVGVTRTMGAQMEKNSTEWVCPLCRKATSQQNSEHGVPPRTHETHTPATAVCCAYRPCQRPIKLGFRYCGGDTCVIERKHMARFAQQQQLERAQRYGGDLARGGRPDSSSRQHSQFSSAHVSTAARRPEISVSPYEKNVDFQSVLDIGSSGLKAPKQSFRSNHSLKYEKSKLSDAESSEQQRKLLLEKHRGLEPNHFYSNSLVDFRSKSEKNSLKSQSGNPILNKHSPTVTSSHANRADPDYQNEEAKRERKKARKLKQKQQERVQAGVTSPSRQPTRLVDVERLRANVRKMMIDVLHRRIKDDSSISSKPGLDIESVVKDIENELFQIHGDVNFKYKAKYRSLIFNLKDMKNGGLFRKVVLRSIDPAKLVKMSADELASKELAKWREQEEKKELEAIEKHELDLISLGSRYMMKTHKGEHEIESHTHPPIRDTLSLYNKSDVSASSCVSATNVPTDSSISQPDTHTYDSVSDKSSLFLSCFDDSFEATHHNTSTSPSKHPPLSHAKKHKHSSSHDRHKSHRRHHSNHVSRNKHAHSSHKSASHSRHKSSAHHSKHSGSSKRSGSDHSERGTTVSDVSTQQPADGAETACVDTVSASPAFESNNDNVVDQQADSVSTQHTDPSNMCEQEQPSSTVKTPPSTDTDTKHSADELVWKGTIFMPDICKFFTHAHLVSGNTADLKVELPNQLDIVGRILPETIWKYITQIRKSSRELVVVRLLPVTDEEKLHYIALYSYLSRKDRFAVINIQSKIIKDLYIVPLPSTSDIPKVLLPFHGPGLSETRPHMLLGVIVYASRHKPSAVERGPDTNKHSDKSASRQSRSKTVTFGNGPTTPTLSSSTSITSSLNFNLLMSNDKQLSDSLDEVCREGAKACMNDGILSDGIATSANSRPSTFYRSHIDDDEPYDPGAATPPLNVEDDECIEEKSYNDPTRIIDELNRRISERAAELESMSGKLSSDAPAESSTLPSIYEPSDPRHAGAGLLPDRYDQSSGQDVSMYDPTEYTPQHGTECADVDMTPLLPVSHREVETGGAPSQHLPSFNVPPPPLPTQMRHSMPPVYMPMHPFEFAPYGPRPRFMRAPRFPFYPRQGPPQRYMPFRRRHR